MAPAVAASLTVNSDRPRTGGDGGASVNACAGMPGQPAAVAAATSGRQPSGGEAAACGETAPPAVVPATGVGGAATAAAPAAPTAPPAPTAPQAPAAPPPPAPAVEPLPPPSAAPARCGRQPLTARSPACMLAAAALTCAATWLAMGLPPSVRRVGSLVAASTGDVLTVGPQQSVARQDGGACAGGGQAVTHVAHPVPCTLPWSSSICKRWVRGLPRRNVPWSTSHDVAEVLMSSMVPEWPLHGGCRSPSSPTTAP
mmetsp:Transcript_150533/g.419470  ORF Transcript_150533/g.419470 Transcript_150533/m.419470 type:complete len:256 (+) Transcript_150533:527-1294(+)